MFLSSPLEALATPERARVLTVLVRAGQPLSGRIIASLTGSVSQPTVARLLQSLTRIGLVRRVPGGYELNRDHLAYQAAELLLGATDELARRAATEVSTWDDPPLAVALFGSVARGDARAGSDLDLLAVRPTHVAADDERWSRDVAVLTERVSDWTGSPCSVLEYDARELTRLRRAGDPLATALERESVRLVGPAITDLLAASAR